MENYESLYPLILGIDFITSLVRKRKLQKSMELRRPHIIFLYHVFLENDGKKKYAQLLEEEFYKMFDRKKIFE